MKLAVLIAAGLLVFAGVLASSTGAQEAPLDLGEQDVFVAACNSVVPVGAAAGLVVRNCRRAAPDEVLGNTAVVHLRIATDLGPYVLDVDMSRSLWQVAALRQRSP